MTIFVYPLGLEHTGHHLWNAISGKITSPVSKKLFQFELGLANTSGIFNELATSFREASTSLHFIGSCSYPCDKPYHDPNVSLVQTAAERANVDLRYLLLTRPMIEVVYDFTVERLQSLISSGHALLRDLSFLPPSKIYCIPYHDTVRVAENISRFLGRDITQAIITTFKPRPKPHVNHLRHRIEWKELLKVQKELDGVCDTI